jgi:hypothetical protein
VQGEDLAGACGPAGGGDFQAGPVLTGGPAPNTTGIQVRQMLFLDGKLASESAGPKRDYQNRLSPLKHRARTGRSVPLSSTKQPINKQRVLGVGPASEQVIGLDRVARGSGRGAATISPAQILGWQGCELPGRYGEAPRPPAEGIGLADDGVSIASLPLQEPILPGDA